MPILEEFYLPIFSSGRIKEAWFIPGWRTSTGARWEREKLTAFGVQTVDIYEHQLDMYLTKLLADSSQGENPMATLIA